MKISNSFVSFKNNFRQTDMNSDSKIRFADAHRVLNDSLMQDSIAINLAQEIANAKAGKNSIRVEDFVKNVLELFSFNKRVQESSKDLVVLNETQDAVFYAYKDQIERNAQLKNELQEKTIKEDTCCDDSLFLKRVSDFDDDLQVDLKFTSPEVVEAFSNMDEKILELIPDSVLSHVLKKCSDENPIFLNSDINLSNRILIYRGIRDYNGEKCDNITLLNKTYTVRNVVSNLSTLASTFTLEELSTLFEKNEDGEFVRKKAPNYLQNLILSHPNGAYYNGYMVDLYNCLGYFK